MDIRKVSIGPDYKGGAMHYIIKQDVIDENHKIHLIKYDEEKMSIKIFIINEKQEVMLWKEFTTSMPIAIEYNIVY